MYKRAGDGWNISAGTHGQMLLALYFRDLAGIRHAGQPVLSPLSPPVKPAAAHEVYGHSGAELRQEWQQWWHRILRGDEGIEQGFSPPSFPAFNDSPTLQRLIQAHYGTALSWTRARQAEYDAISREHDARGRRAVLERMIRERGLELDREPKPLALTLLELPLAEPRAWFVDPGTVILSQDLPCDEELFRSFLQPVIELLL